MNAKKDFETMFHEANIDAINKWAELHRTINTLHIFADGVDDHKIRDGIFIFIDRMRRVLNGEDYRSTKEEV